MMNTDLIIIPKDLLEQYKKSIDPSLKNYFDALSDSELSFEAFSFTLPFQPFSLPKLRENTLNLILI